MTGKGLLNMKNLCENYLLDKKVKIYQPKNGYHASSDAVWLAAAIKKVNKGDKILDVGSGTGAVSLCLAERFADWLQNDTLDRGGCSLTDVFRLIDKWEWRGRGAPCEGLRGLYRDYIKRHGDVSYFKKQGLW
jgi:hypothetical protein